MYQNHHSGVRYKNKLLLITTAEQLLRRNTIMPKEILQSMVITSKFKFNKNQQIRYSGTVMTSFDHVMIYQHVVTGSKQTHYTLISELKMTLYKRESLAFLLV